MHKLMTWLSCLFVFLFPIQTVWIVSAPSIGGDVWEYGKIVWYASEVILWLLFGIFFVSYLRMWRSRRSVRVMRDRYIVGGILGAVLYGFLSVVWASAPDVAFQYARWVLEAGILFLLLRYVVRGPVLVAWSFVSGLVFQSLLGMWQFFTQYVPGDTLLGVSEHVAHVPGTSVVVGQEIGRWLRAYGTLPHPNMLGGFLVLGIAVTGLLYMKTRQQAHRILLLVFGLLQASTLALSFSRGAWIGLLLVCVLLLIYFRKHFYTVWTLVSSVGVLFVVWLVLLLPLTVNRLGVQGAHELVSVEERVQSVDVAGELFLSALWFGVGAGNYTAAYMQLAPGNPVWVYQPVHNALLLWAVQYGVTGSVLACILLVVWGWFERLRRVVFIGGTIVVLGLFDHYLVSMYAGLMVCVVFAGLSARLLPSTSTRSSPYS